MSSSQVSLQQPHPSSLKKALRPTLKSKAIAILSDLWGSDSAAWKPADCGFGSHPLSWPPRMLTALADLARAAGRGARKRDSALRLVEDLVAREQRKDGRLCKATPEHVNQAAEILAREAAEAKERRRASAGDDRRDARRHSTAGREEYVDDRRYAREDERERDAGVGFSFRGAAGQRRVSSRDDAYYGDVDRGFSRDMRSRQSPKPREYHKSERAYTTSYEQSAKQEQRVAPEPDQPRYTKPSSDSKEQFAKEDQGSVPKPLQSNNTSTTAVTADETAKLHPQRAKRLLEGDDTESDETNKKFKLTDANMTLLPSTTAFKASQQPSMSQPAPAETSQPHTTTIPTHANSSKDIANTNNAATQTDKDGNKNKDLIAHLEAELATLQAQIATQTEQLAEERATQSELSAAMDQLKLDLDLTDAARAATEADAGKWRAFGPGMRAIMRDNKRLVKVEMQKEKLEREAAGLRAGMRVAQQKCVEAEARAEACDVDVEKVRVVRGDGELKMVNAVLRRENEALRAKLDELGVPVGRAHEKAEKPVG
ncbi:hypothetical protein DIS24_g1133 [Lasiodiplodia hormozganensis]|uniref:Uncharacterized protein n=1 Tax=Lasiodiplodia hormozganensis TaxID=869390 RepID=A0AA39Z424_9PEZI|nr:hypothetical protein DIS24_g1133 [Lasiodiplodia hormozganensis]